VRGGAERQRGRSLGGAAQAAVRWLARAVHPHPRRARAAGPRAVKLTGLTQNLQVDPAV
jgi:hypothetical protein